MEGMDVHFEILVVVETRSPRPLISSDNVLLYLGHHGPGTRSGVMLAYSMENARNSEKNYTHFILITSSSNEFGRFWPGYSFSIIFLSKFAA